MEVKKVYVKKRSEFGKQCIFYECEPTLDVEIPPNPAEMRNYLTKDQCHVSQQKATQLAGHEAQTLGKLSKNTGMCHFEGGWPKEINPRDEETTARFRRRVEKDDSWAPKLQNLFTIMEGNVLQNGAVNIYEHYFDDMVPTELVQPVSLRAVKAYTDPERPKRPVSNISVSPDDGRRIVISYCFLDFGRRSDYSYTVYVWQVDNPNEPYMAMKPFCPCVTSEFNPRDPSLLISGLMTGQVCIWDLRISGNPLHYSDLLFSHRAYANAVKWLPSKTNTEFFSTSLDGCAFWWDTRWIRRPTEKLTMDLEKPNDPSMDRAIGISSLNFGPMVGTKFMFGMDNGLIVTGSRKAKSNAEKLAAKFDAHYGPVTAVDRNVLNPAIFMSVGDWRVRIWAEDTREGNLLSTLYMHDNPTTGCWDKMRNSVFYVATDVGTLVAWDILQKLRKPIFKLQLCDTKITAIAPYEEGTYMAVGNYNGTSYLVESTEFLQYFDRKDRAALSEYLERCSKLTKAVDVRLREIKLMQKLTAEEEEAAALLAASTPKAKGKKKASKKEKDKDSKHGKESKKKVKDDVMTVQLTEAENKYYELVGQELLKYANVSEPDLRPIGPIMSGGKKQDRKGKGRDKDNASKEAKKKGARGTPETILRRRTSLSRSKVFKKSSAPAYTVERVVPSVVLEVPIETERLDRRKKKQNVKFRLPVPCKKEICKPKVCCFRRKTGSSRKNKKKSKTSLTPLQLMNEFTGSTSKKRVRGSRSRSLKALTRWKMLDLPAELIQEVERAKREIKELTPSGRVCWRKRTTENVQEEKRRSSDSERSQKTIDSEDNREEKEEDSSVDEEDSMTEPSPIRKGRKTRDGPDPCTLPKAKSISKEFSAMIGVPMPTSIEETVEEGKAYMREMEAIQTRIYPRISEFHTIE